MLPGFESFHRSPIIIVNFCFFLNSAGDFEERETGGKGDGDFGQFLKPSALIFTG